MPVPHPNDAAANKTNECVAECPQGKGSEAETKAYGDCIAKCIGDNYFSATVAPTAKPTGSGANSVPATSEVVSTVTSGSATFETTVTPTASSSGSSESGSSDSDSDSNNDSDASSSEPPNAGAMLAPLGSTGLLGLVAAFLAI